MLAPEPRLRAPGQSPRLVWGGALHVAAAIVTAHLEHRLERQIHDLTVRPSAKAGDPILPGVLGRDELIFDMIGDVISVAERLQSTYS
jgi:class 3 adenylate cyclase